MENNFAVDQTEPEGLSYEISDDVLEIAAAARTDGGNNITMYFCTALYFCPRA
jgi:hypothetical protein